MNTYFKDVLSFRVMVTPVVVQAVFWVSTSLLTFSWFLFNLVFAWATYRMWVMDVLSWYTVLMAGFVELVSSLATLACALLGLRLACEATLVHFKIHEAVERIGRSCRKVRVTH